MIWVMIMMINSIILAGPPDMPNNGYGKAEHLYRVPNSVLYGMEWTFSTFPNPLRWMPHWSLETGFTRILVNEYHAHRVMYHILNDFLDEFFIHDSSPEKNIIGDFRSRVLFKRRRQPTSISTFKTLVHLSQELENKIETHGSIAFKEGGGVFSFHSSFEYYNEHYNYTSFQKNKEHSYIAIDDMTSLNVMNRKRATIDTFKQGEYLIDLLTSWRTIRCMRYYWDFEDIFWNHICINKTKAPKSAVLNKYVCYVGRLCVDDWESYNCVRELYINSEKCQSCSIDPSVNIDFYNVFKKEYSDNFHSGIYTHANFYIKSHFLYFDTIRQEQRRFWSTEDKLKKGMVSKWNITIILTVGISTECCKRFAEFSVGGKSHVLKKRRTGKKNINNLSISPEVLSNCQHLVDSTNKNAELIKTHSSVGRIIRSNEEHTVRKNASLSFNTSTSILSSVNEMFSTILIYFETCQYFIRDFIHESFYNRPTSTIDNTRNYKYAQTFELFYGENYEHTSRYIDIWNVFSIIIYLEFALIHIFLLGYKLKVKPIFTFVTNQIMNLSGDSSHCQRGCENMKTQSKHEAKATEMAGSKSVVKELDCDLTKSSQLAVNSDTYENHHITCQRLQAKYAEEEKETHCPFIHQARIKTDTTSVKRVFGQNKDDVLLSSSVLPSDDDGSEETSVKSFHEQEENNAFMVENNDDETNSNTKTRFSMQETLNDKLIVNDSKKHWEIMNQNVSVFPDDSFAETQSNSFGMITHDETFKSSMSFQSSTKNGEHWSSLLPVSHTTINEVCSSKQRKSLTPIENDESHFVKDVFGNCDSEVSRRILEKERHLTSGSMKTTTRYLAEKECSLKIKKLRRRHALFAKHVRRFFKKQERKSLKHNKRRILRRICPRYPNIHHNTESLSVCCPAISRQSSQNLPQQESVTPTSHVLQENHSPYSHTSDQMNSTGTLSSIFNHISIESSRDDRSYHSEWMRLASFGRFESDDVHAVRLARSGWYSTGLGDQTVCFSCQRLHQNWRRNDNPDNFHNANCSYVNLLSNNIPIPRETSIASDGVRFEESQNTGHPFYRDHATNNTRFPLSQGENLTTERLSAQNVASSSDSNSSAIPSTSDLRSSSNTSVPESTDQAAASLEETKRAQLEALKKDPMGINFDRPKYPSYAILSERIKSFSDWPASMTQTPRDMALAGFFYAGYGDYTRCFFCGGGLRNWEAGDDPCVEHARWFSKCAFVRQNKGQGFIDQVLQRAAELERQENPTKEDDKKAKDEKVMQSEAVLCIKRMGYTDEIIRSAIDTMKTRLPRGKHKVSAQEILEVVFELSSSQQTVKEERDLNTDIGSTEVPQTTGDDNSEMGASCLDTIHDDELTSLELENRNLKGQLMCMICTEKNVSIAFLPCGHLTCCEDCAPAMRKCPICREFVRGTVKTFLV